MVPVLLVALACGLDRLVGDPRAWLHPVVVMGWLINRLRGWAERWAHNSPWRLRLAGCAIAALLVSGSALAGWGVERLAWSSPLGAALLVVALASALAGRSLEQAVQEVLQALPDLPQARQRLSWIVGRDTEELQSAEILRAAAETASENAVDGLFAPLFWMLCGAGLWGLGWAEAPGPLAWAWAFKAASTLDSMLGYRRGTLTWLGSAGARLDDLLVWLPCRLVALSLPLVAGRGGQSWQLLHQALADGRPDPSPNAGVSQAAYARTIGVELGGDNRYGTELLSKPLLAAGCPAPDASAVTRMLVLSRRLELLWLLLAAGLALLAQVGLQR